MLLFYTGRAHRWKRRETFPRRRVSRRRQAVRLADQVLNVSTAAVILI